MAEVAGRGEELDVEAVVKGVRDAIARSESSVTSEQLRPVLEAFQSREQTRASEAKAEFERVAAENRARSTQFLASNGAQEGVKTLPGGVQYKVLEAGSGAKPTPTSTVSLEVAGPFPFGLRQPGQIHVNKVDTIKINEMEMAAMRQAILQMPTGAKWEITVPSERAYGNDPRTPFPPNVVVQFEIKLTGIH